MIGNKVDVLGDAISSISLEKVCAEDLDVVNSARISYAKHKEAMDLGDEKLIEWLAKNKHTSPFSHNYFKFNVKAPIFVARQWFKHTVFHSYNEVSLRYTDAKPEFYTPLIYRKRVGKPGNYTYEQATSDENINSLDIVGMNNNSAWNNYKALMDSGVAPEQARLVLPTNIYTQFIWSCNALSLMNFIELRSHATAQHEIRVYSDAAYKALEAYMPVTARAFKATLGEGYNVG